MMQHEPIDMRRGFENDLRYLTDEDIERELNQTQDLVDRETSWVEALTAEREARAQC